MLLETLVPQELRDRKVLQVLRELQVQRVQLELLDHKDLMELQVLLDQ